MKWAVDVLEANSLIEVDFGGNRRLVGTNRSRVSKLDALTLRIPQPEFHRPVRTALERLREEIDDVLGAVLFGSVTNGRADRQSDVDFWVLTGKRGQQHRAIEISEELAKERFDGNRYAFQSLVETPESASGLVTRLRDVFDEAITLVTSCLVTRIPLDDECLEPRFGSPWIDVVKLSLNEEVHRSTSTKTRSTAFRFPCWTV